jgi:hypothetical protein
MRVRRTAKFAALVLVGVAVVAAVGPFGGTVLDGAEMRNASVDVYVSGSPLESIETGPDGARSCTSVGPPPGTATVDAEAVVYDSQEGRGVSTKRYSLVLGVEGETTSRTVEVTEGFNETASLTGSVVADGLEPGDDVAVNVSIRNNGDTVDSVTRTVTVEEREFRCADID